MILTFNVSDEFKNQNFYLLAGLELVGYKNVGESEKNKISRCSMCGKCCEKINCSFLELNGKCGIVFDGEKSLYYRPTVCAISHGPRKSIPECTEQFE